MNRNRKTKEILICVFMATCVLFADIRDAKGDFVFGQAQNAGSVINTSLTEMEPIPEPLSLWFTRRSGPGGASEYWRASRAIEDAPWETPVNFGPWDDSYWNLIKTLPRYTTADGLEVYFYAGPELSGGYGGYDIWMKKRENIDDDWGPTENLGPIVNSAYAEALPAISPDGLELYFSEWGEHTRQGGHGKTDLWVTRRNTKGDPWSEPENLGQMVNTASNDQRPILVGDGLLLFFESNRSGGFGSLDLYMMRRATIADPWTEPINLGPMVNSPNSDEQGFLSPDGSTLYFHSNRPGGYGIYDIWQASVEPVVDLNADGIVDAADICIMVDNWGTDEPLCDIGPTPFGDGVVDVQDMIVLAEHLFEEIPPVEEVE